MNIGLKDLGVKDLGVKNLGLKNLGPDADFRRRARHAAFHVSKTENG